MEPGHGNFGKTLISRIENTEDAGNWIVPSPARGMDLIVRVYRKYSMQLSSDLYPEELRGLEAALKRVGNQAAVVAGRLEPLQIGQPSVQFSSPSALSVQASQGDALTLRPRLKRDSLWHSAFPGKFSTLAGQRKRHS